MTSKQKKMLLRIILAAVFMLIFVLIPFDCLLPSPGDERVRFVVFLIPYFIVGYDILRKAIKSVIDRQAFGGCFLIVPSPFGGCFPIEISASRTAARALNPLADVFQSIFYIILPPPTTTSSK